MVKYTGTLLGNAAAAGAKDSITITVNPMWDISMQVFPVFCTTPVAGDSIYVSLKAFVSNSLADEVWSPLVGFNDTYSTVYGDTLLIKTTIPTQSVWRYSKTEFPNARLKVLFTTLAKTNENNIYKIYFIAKPQSAWTHMY
jgi:hypothetical protein